MIKMCVRRKIPHLQTSRQFRLFIVPHVTMNHLVETACPCLMLHYQMTKQKPLSVRSNGKVMALKIHLIINHVVPFRTQPSC